MVVEHTFVTTLDAQQTMQSAMQFLALRGFERPPNVAFPVNQEWTTLEMRRGKTKAGKARNVAELPQTAHVEWDRGRVVIALSIEPSHVWGGSQVSFGLNVGSATGKPSKMTLHTDMLMAIANGLERVLTRGDAPETAGEPWAALDEHARLLAKRRTRNQIITVVVIFALLAGLITLLVMNA